MKSLNDIEALFEEFKKTYGLNIDQAQQGSAMWLTTKLGVISASKASDIVAKKDSATRLTYMSELVAQVCTGITKELSTKEMAWGNDHEDGARALYELMTLSRIQPVPFVFRANNFREGCSPDGILLNHPKGVEIKCPFDTTNYIKFLCDDKIKPEYEWQAQYTLRVMEADEWDFAQYDPRMVRNPIHIITVKRDAEKQAKFDDMIPAFIEDMDKMLAKIGVKFGDQWSRLALVQNREVQNAEL